MKSVFQNSTKNSSLTFMDLKIHEKYPKCWMLYQVMLGCTGKCLNVLGYARMCKDVLGYARLYQDLLGYTGNCLDVVGYTRMC